MADLTAALAPAFACGFAVQQLLELSDPVLSRSSDPLRKKIYASAISLIAGFVFAHVTPLSVLRVFQTDANRIIDVIVTALIVSAGTEGFNSVMKFLGDKKEEQKADAAKAKQAADGAMKSVNRGASGVAG